MGTAIVFFTQGGTHDDADKRLGLVVPFECPLENLKAEAEKVVRALARELETATIETS